MRPHGNCKQPIASVYIVRVVLISATARFVRRAMGEGVIVIIASCCAELAETLGSKNKLRDTYLETSFRGVRFSDFVHLAGLSTGLASSFAYLRAYM